MITLATTEDGSHTLVNTQTGESYRSQNGAAQESSHVFIDTGLAHVAKQNADISLLEIGFGSGLNFLLTADFALKNPHITIKYTALEPFLVPCATLKQLNYASLLQNPRLFEAFLSWYEQENTAVFSPQKNIELQLLTTPLLEYSPTQKFDLIYYDAFSANTAPEMWQPTALEHSAKLLRKGGIWVSYSARGTIKHSLRNAQMVVTKLPGAAGKREMMRGFLPY